jgi:Yip1 domain
MNLVERVKAILLTPKTEWPVIDQEPGDTGYLFTNYVAILAAIPAVAGFIGGSIVGVMGYRTGFFSGLMLAIVSYILAFVGTFVLAFIIDLLAPNFSSQKSFPSAMKLAVYSSTAAWLAGIFSIIPVLAFLNILGLYSLYLLYTGLPVLMRTPAEKQMTYTIAVVVCAIIVWLVIGALPVMLIS